MGEWHRIARVADVAAGDVIAAAVGDLALAVSRDGDRFIVTQRYCPHRGGDLTLGIVSRGHIVCPSHGWRFSTATGLHDAASESQSCLQLYPVRVVGDAIEVELPSSISPGV